MLFFLVYRFRRFSTSVQENLIRGPGDLSDLVAINTVRSYERGLPGYTAFRRFCGLRPVNNFRQLRNRAGFTNEATANLRRVFTSVHDIPLFTGGRFALTQHATVPDITVGTLLPLPSPSMLV